MLSYIAIPWPVGWPIFLSANGPTSIKTAICRWLRFIHFVLQVSIHDSCSKLNKEWKKNKSQQNRKTLPQCPLAKIDWPQMYFYITLHRKTMSSSRINIFKYKWKTHLFTTTSKFPLIILLLRGCEAIHIKNMSKFYVWQVGSWMIWTSSKVKIFAQSRPPLYVRNHKARHISQVESFCIEYIITAFSSMGFLSCISLPLEHSASYSFCFMQTCHKSKREKLTL